MTWFNRVRIALLVLCLLLFATPGYAADIRTMGLIFRDSTADFPGYTLFAPMSYNVAYLIDNNGMMVHSWTGTYWPGLSVYLCPNGLLLRTCQVGNGVFFGGGGSGGRVELVDWDGAVVWAFDYSTSTYCQHHDAIMLPNGNILMIAWELKSREEAIAAGRNPDLLVYNALWPDHLVEVNPATDSIVWEWHIWDHLIQDYDSTKPNYGDPRAYPELIDLNYVSGMAVADWNHCNGVAYNQELDQILLSSRQFSEVWVIDHSTTIEQARSHSGGRYGRGGDLLYRWGNPRTYRRQETIGQTLFGQHDAQWIEPGLPGAGHILLFNNGYGRVPTYSTVDEFVPPMDSLGFYHLGADSAYGPAAPIWQYVPALPESLYSSLISGCQRLPNGNTLVCSGLNGTILEVTPDGREVWKYVNPVTRHGPQEQGRILPAGANQVFKARRYPIDYSGLRGRNLDPLGPIEQYPQVVKEEPVVRFTGNFAPIMLKDAVTLTGMEFADVVDPMGRRVMRLNKGRNDIHRLAPGVYFLVGSRESRKVRIVKVQ